MKASQRIFARKEPGRHPRRALAVPRRKILLAYHDAWRTAAEDVEAAWRGWRAAPASGRADAAFAFAAALDREERAAAVYRVKWGA